MDETDQSDHDRQIDQFYREMDVIHAQRDKGVYTTSARAARDLARRMKHAGLLGPYMLSTFTVANSGGNTLEVEAAYEASIELISLIEDDTRRRSIQADYPEGVDAWADQWRVPCYHLLAMSQGRLKGFNSDGMHACIAAGLQVARQTGSSYVSSFHEFATDVHMAADDLDLAMHHARANAIRPPGSNREDRRWVGAKDVFDILSLQGRLADSREAGKACIDLCASWHAEEEAYYECARLFQANLLISGLATDQASLEQAMESYGLRPPEAVYAPPPNEDIDHDLLAAQHQALLSAVVGDYDAAIATLTSWDQLLRDKLLSRWFEVRLRLIAATRMARQDRRAEALAKELQQKATAANDFVTLTQLKLLFDPQLPVAPVPPTEPYDDGPWAGRRKAVATGVEVADDRGGDAGDAGPPADATPEQKPEQTPAVQAWWTRLGQAMQAAMDENESRREAFARAGADAEPPTAVRPDLASLVAEVLAGGFGDHAADAEERLRLLAVASENGGLEVSVGADAWAWAQKAVAAHGSGPRLTSLLPAIGDPLRRQEGSPLATAITVDGLEALAREAMKAAPETPAVFRRAARFYLRNDRVPDAERCLSRAFRLERTDPWAAGELAEIYATTDRRTAALAVLDLAIRDAGPESADPMLLWKAAMLAQDVEQFASSLTYLDRFAEIAPGYPALQFYRSAALLELKRTDEAQAAIDAETAAARERAAEGGRPDIADAEPLHIASIRGAVAGQRGDAEQVGRSIDQALAVPLSQLEWMSPLQMQRSLDRLWTASSALPPDDGRRVRLRTVYGLSGLTPGTFWQGLREQGVGEQGVGEQGGSAQEGEVQVRHYVVLLTQPLDERWRQSPFCLPDQIDWTAYSVIYGVLARTAADAADTAVRTQSWGHELPPVVNAVERQPGGFRDRVGVTSRSWPRPAEPDALDQRWDGIDPGDDDADGPTE